MAKAKFRLLQSDCKVVDVGNIFDYRKRHIGTVGDALKFRWQEYVDLTTNVLLGYGKLKYLLASFAVHDNYFHAGLLNTICISFQKVVKSQGFPMVERLGAALSPLAGLPAKDAHEMYEGINRLFDLAKFGLEGLPEVGEESETLKKLLLKTPLSPLTHNYIMLMSSSVKHPNIEIEIAKNADHAMKLTRHRTGAIESKDIFKLCIKYLIDHPGLEGQGNYIATPKRRGELHRMGANVRENHGVSLPGKPTTMWEATGDEFARALEGQRVGASAGMSHRVSPPGKPKTMWDALGDDAAEALKDEYPRRKPFGAK